MIKQSDTGQGKIKAIAIADGDDDASPTIAAKGTGKRAEKILQLAFDNNVKVRQDKELTDILELFDEGSPVPFEALSSISQILEYVYLANARAERQKNRDAETAYSGADGLGADEKTCTEAADLASPIKTSEES